MDSTTVQEFVDEQNDELDKRVEKLKGRLASIVHKAEVALLVYLAGLLLIKNGRVAVTAANVKLLNGLSKKFLSLLQDYGYDSEINRFFPMVSQQTAAFKHLLKVSGIKQVVDFTEEDVKGLVARRKLAMLDALSVSDQMADHAAQAAVLSLGGTRDDLYGAITETLDKTVGRTTVKAVTASSTFYRATTALGYQKLQTLPQTPGSTLRFAYVGPGSGDPVIRRFCKHLMQEAEQGRTWTRAEIDVMDNGQLPNVAVTCGGYECRHEWVACP